MNAIASKVTTVLRSLSSRSASTLERDRSTLKMLRWGCVVVGWLAAIAIALTALPYLRLAVHSGFDAPLLNKWGIVTWESTLGTGVLVRLFLALLAGGGFLAMGEVFSWMLAVESHLSALRSRGEDGRP